MSVDSTRPDDPRHDLDLTHIRRTLPRPAEHGGSAQLLNPDGGDLYERLRQLWYDVVDDPRDEPVQVGTIEQDGGREDLAVMFRSSPWKAGEGTGDDYQQWYKYHLTLRPIDPVTGEIEDRTPLDATSLLIMPQLRGLVQPDGSPLDLQHGTGTLIQCQTTWISRFEQYVDRTERVLDAVFDEPVLQDLSRRESAKKWWKGEVHHRFLEDHAQSVVHVLSRSKDLIVLEGGSVEDGDFEYSADGGWKIYKFASSRWDLLGFDTDCLPPGGRVLIKCYLPDAPLETLDFPMDQPKLETALLTKDGQRKPHADEFEEIHDLLRSILLSHIAWADVPEGALLPDERSLGNEAEPYEWDHPRNRRTQLQEWYASREPSVYAEATRTFRDRAGLAYDVLARIVETDGAHYEQLVEWTGASYSAIQRQARRLEEKGILERLRGAGANGEVLLTWSAPEMRSTVQSVIDQVHPADDPQLREERAEERRRERAEWRDVQSSQDLPERERDDPRGAEESRDQDDVDSSSEGSAEGSADGSLEGTDEGTDDGDRDRERSVWRYFGDVPLTPEQLGFALDRGDLQEDDVRVRLDRSALFPSVG